MHPLHPLATPMFLFVLATDSDAENASRQIKRQFYSPLTNVAKTAEQNRRSVVFQRNAMSRDGDQE